MKNNYPSSKNYRNGLVTIMLLFFGFFANEAEAQSAVANHDTYTWIGVTSSDWTTATNWSILRGTANPGIGTYPGEVVGTDVVFINNSGTPFPAILDGQIIDIARLNVTNAIGGEAGATFTINAGAILNVGNYTLTVGTTNVTQSNNVLLAGGSIVNNGTLNITGKGVGFTSFPSYGINCGNPPVLPTVPREYTYSGTGTLTINLVNANFAGAAAIAVTGNSAAPSPAVAPIPFANNANVTYRIVLNDPEITLNQASTASIQAIRAAGGNNANKMIIGGTGLTYGTVGTPLLGGLINLSGGSSLTIEAGTTLNWNSAAANTFSAISGFSGSTFATNFTNKGTINILGSSARSGMFFSTATALVSTTNPAGVSPIFNINNEGTLNINLNITSGGQAGLTIGNGGGAAASAGVAAVNVNNTGTMNLKNTSVAVGSGFSIFTVTASEAAPLFITNSGTLNLEGSTYNYGLKTTLNNSGILNTNSEFRGFTAVNNNNGGSINFARTAATATTRQVTFTILTETDTSGALGSIYKDSNNNDYAIVAQKFSGGFSLLANALTTTTVPVSGTLTRSTGTGSATIIYSAVSLPAINNAAGNVNNSGIINTDTASNLNILALLSTSATSVLSPGGNTGKGILTVPELPSAAADFLALQGTLKIQANGSATAGVDYDTMQITGLLDVIDINGATLDVTGLYTPAVFTTIDIITTNTTVGSEGAVVGSFASVVGLPAKWTVVINPGLGNKVQLVYDPSLGTDSFKEAQFSYYPNPAKNELNLSAAQNISKVSLFNILGQNVLSETVDANQKQINVSNLQKGVYVMEVTIDNATQSFKIVKQ
jgi:Secretion system C-terminal sorting domain